MSDRHEKWVPVEPGAVIPAGQPYRVEWNEKSATETWSETDQRIDPQASAAWFIDSSWHPQLELPTKETWGIAVMVETHPMAGKWYVHANGEDFRSMDYGSWLLNEVLDFIPLTDQQVSRIEGQR